MPQIEVSFNIDANGILNVSAKDKATGKAQSIVIKASSGLSEEEIQRMVKDAEANREEDRKFHELVMVRNQADGLLHAVSKSLQEAGDKVQPAERAQIETAINELKEAVKGDNKAVIENKIKALTDVSAKLAEGGATSGGAETTGSGSATDQAKTKSADEVVDAEFEEVKDKDKQ